MWFTDCFPEDPEPLNEIALGTDAGSVCMTCQCSLLDADHRGKSCRMRCERITRAKRPRCACVGPGSGALLACSPLKQQHRV